MTTAQVSRQPRRENGVDGAHRTGDPSTTPRARMLEVRDRPRRTSMRIAIMGSGGIGGIVGGKLALSGTDVVFIARGAHLRAMQSSGLQILSDLGNVAVPRVHATDDPAEPSTAIWVDRERRNDHHSNRRPFEAVALSVWPRPHPQAASPPRVGAELCARCPPWRRCDGLPPGTGQRWSLSLSTVDGALL